jgi:hypothetical protein
MTTHLMAGLIVIGLLLSLTGSMVCGYGDMPRHSLCWIIWFDISIGMLGVSLLLLIGLMMF